MKKLKLKKPHNLLAVIIIMIIIGIFITLNYIGNHITPIILNYAEKQAKKVAINIIVQAANPSLLELDNDMLFQETSDGVEYNTITLSKLLERISKSVRTYLKKIEAGDIKEIDLSNLDTNVSIKKLKNGIIYEVPTGIIFNNGLLSNIGPKIPVKLSLVGDITTDIKTNIKEYGINNAIIEISIKVTVTEQVVIPFNKKDVIIEADIPLAIRLVKGEVPGYYMSPYTLSTK